MITGQSRLRSEPARSGISPGTRGRVWPAYLGIAALLVLIVLALAGGIIWYNLRKSTDLMVATVERQMAETGEKISDRVELLYDPLYAIVGIASQVPDIKAPLRDGPHTGLAMLMRMMRFYPQVLSLFVGFDNGDFFMLSHVAGESRARFRTTLKAPESAAFANKIVTAKDGPLTERWIFFDDDGNEVGHTNPAPSDFDPRGRPWYKPALHGNRVELSDLYIFALNDEPGFTLSRGFQSATPGVFGADMAAVDLSDFLSKQRITPTSLSFIFTRSGEIVAYPDQTRMAALVPTTGEIMVALPQLSELKDPVATGLFEAYRNSGTPGNFVYNVAGRGYIGRVVEVPARYGRDQLLGISVPLDEIEEPVIAVRNQTLFYSVAFLVLVLPLYVTLIVALIDRRLGRRTPPFRIAEDG
jgi:adenylate cyclase